MARPPTEEGDIKVAPEVHEKRAFIKASKAARQSLSQWMIQAAIERAERQGVPVEKKGRR
jgi:uncharacterized protein (DUF1778 family)